MKKDNHSNKRYIYGINALRSLGVLGVIFYHVTPKLLPGGYLAVQIFFVLTGFLLTRSLLAEYRASREIRWKEFFLKRIKRIYPQMLLVFLVSAFFFLIFQPKMLTGMRETFLSSLFSVNNWWQIADGASYFANFAQTANNAFKHVYFLSIEGQFAVVLALLMLILPKKKGKKLPVIMLLLLSLVSGLAMALMFKTGGDPTRVYYGTDTRIFALLIGAALAFAESGQKVRLKRRLVQFLALIAFLEILAAMFLLPDKSVFVYRGGMYLFSLLAALIIWLFATLNFGRNRLLSNGFFKYLGSRSYAIYLWQLPVFAVVENWGINSSLWYNVLWELALILLLSEISYRLVEKPFGQISLESVKEFFTRNLRSVRKLPIYALIPLGIAGLVIIVSSPAQSEDIKRLEKTIAGNKLAVESHNRELLTSKGSSSSSAVSSSSSASSSGDSTESKPSSTSPESSKASEETADTPSSSSSTTASSTTSASSAPSSTESSPVVPADYPMAAVGDSVMLDVSDRLQQTFPQMYLDGQVGRQADAGAAVLQALPPGILANAKAILIDLGINGTISDADINSVMAVAAGRPVFWVNVRVPRSWEAGDNAALANAAKSHPNLHVLDWYNTSINHPEYFVSDEVHLTSDGITAYVQLITQAVMKQG
ncbi:hypothetical protein OfM1_08350 [Lactovum odontotermitis]